MLLGQARLGLEKVHLLQLGSAQSMKAGRCQMLFMVKVACLLLKKVVPSQLILVAAKILLKVKNLPPAPSSC